MRVLISSLAIVLMTTSLAKSEPSKQETINFILDKVENQTRYRANGFNQSIWFTDNGCTLNTEMPPLNGNIRLHRRVALQEIDPSRVEMQYDNNVFFFCNADNTCIENIHNGRNVENIDSSSFSGWNSSDTTQRVVKALRHLTKLCGGKEELF